MLLVALIAYIGLVPMLGTSTGLRLLVNLGLSVILFLGLYAASEHWHQFVIGLVLVLPTLVLTWTSYFVQHKVAPVIIEGSQIAFFGYTIVIFLAYIFRQRRVTRDVICAAVVVYLFIGLLWAAIYALLESFEPGSLAFSNPQMADQRIHLLYFSYVTLSTLGYGDITPLTSRAGAFAMLEALIGQIFLTVLIARLVGMQVSHASANDSETD